MSFDLYFYKKKGASITEAEVAKYLTENLPFNSSEIDTQWDCENPETGVYFLVDWNDPDPEFANDFDNFSDLTYLNFSCSINFFRPQFFGVEIFPIIEKFVDDLDLWVLNPQDEERPDEPQKFPKGYLQDQWIRHNNGVTQDRFEELGFEYLPLERSNYIWEYQYGRLSLQNSLEEDIFVPGIFVMKAKDGCLCTACVWPQHIPIILPAVDYLIIQKEHKKLFRTVKETGVISYDEILRQFNAVFDPFGSSVPGLKILRQEDADKIAKQFNALVLQQNTSVFASTISMDGFVNIRP